jgi:glutamate carboxypeptidase
MLRTVDPPSVANDYHGEYRMNLSRMLHLRALCTLFIAAAVLAASAFAAPLEPVWSLVQKEKPALLDTLKELVEIESGSSDREGLDRIADVIAGRLKAMGGKVDLIEPGPDAHRDSRTPERIGKMVKATFTGTGTKKILLIAHMDTVYPRGMLAQQPFRIDGDRAYGLGIADDRHGIAVILHALAVLNAMKYRDYGIMTVLINGDEEIGSPASRHVLTRLGAEHDATMSFEGAGANDNLGLATSGSANAIITVRGRASHSGTAPHLGINAIDELAHQIMQNRDLSDPAIGLRANWTLARGGIVTNMIPPGAQATLNIRVLRLADLDGIEAKLRERIQNKLLPQAAVELNFERGRPPLEERPVSRALALHGQKIYAEIGKKLIVMDTPRGGGTDAAYAGLKTNAPVVEGFGLQGFGAHTTNAEYILISSIEPRLYLAARMIMDISTGKAPLSGKP